MEEMMLALCMCVSILNCILIWGVDKIVKAIEKSNNYKNGNSI